MNATKNQIEAGAPVEGAAPAVPVERLLRIPPIVANLLPAEVVQARRTRKIKRTVLSLIAVFSVLLAAWSALASFRTADARAELTRVEQGEQALINQQNAFAELISTQKQSDAITARLAVLLANDLPWSRLLASLQEVAPEGVQITGVSGVLTAGTRGTSNRGGGSSGSLLPNASTARPIGTLTVAGTGTTRAGVAAYVDALGKVVGLANPLLGGATVENDILQFTVQLDITSAALGGRYTPKASEAPKATEKPGG